MYKTSKETQERKDAKRQLIMNTAARVFSQKGYHNTSVKDIVEEASVSIGSFYFYFKSKEELFEELFVTISATFQEVEDRVLDTGRFSLAQNFTRVIAATLWMYEQHRELAKIMLVEAAGVNPAFQKMRMESIKVSSGAMERWFTRFAASGSANIPDVKAAALIYVGSFYYLIQDWLESEQELKLTDSGYALCIYSLQALGITFKEEDIRRYIAEVLEELSQGDEI
ncbi:MAG: transcriptional regulator TetR family [Paenibacillaceae bacterium]|jgi:AcrR family transcriptional regulator|nr:transcriptional regulator TetR family [Paenibacillaceae bacterium]